MNWENGLSKEFMTVSIPVAMLHATNCIYLIAPMRNAKGEYGYVASPIANEMLASQCKPIYDMLTEAVAHYTDVENGVLSISSDGADSSPAS